MLESVVIMNNNMYQMRPPHSNGNNDRFIFPFLTGALVGGAAVGLTRPRPIYNVAPGGNPGYGPGPGFNPRPPYPTYPSYPAPYSYYSYGGYIPGPYGN